MYPIGVVLQGTSPLHLHCQGELRSSSSHRCLFCNGQPTIDAFEISAAMERAAFPIDGGSLSLMLAIFVDVVEVRIPIFSRQVRLSAVGLATDRSDELLYAGLTFDDWRLEFTLKTPDGSGNADKIRHVLELAGRDVGLGYQVDGADLGRFVVQEWNPSPPVVGRSDSPLECAR